MADIRSDYTDRLNFYGDHTPRELLDKHGSPLYVYNEKILRERCREMRGLSRAIPLVVSYSVKANSNPHLLKIIRDEGLHADAMSPGELHMDKLAGFAPEEILYISNNNAPAEMLHAITEGCLVSVDSLSQLDMYGELRVSSRVMIRINPGIGEGHSAKVVTGGSKTKFGIDPARMEDVLALLLKHDLTLAGVNQHIGSLFMTSDKYLAAAKTLLQIVGDLPAEIFGKLEYIDFGGGFGIPYRKYDHEERLDLTALGNALGALVQDWRDKTGYSGKFVIEPGRYVTAECGILLGRVTAFKDTAHIRFVGTDLGFNVLQRPVMYDAFHDLEIYRGLGAAEAPIRQTIVGNLCESGDILAKDRLLPPLAPGDVIGVLDAGAYGFSMASNYTGRYLPAEVLIAMNGQDKLIRRRQDNRDLSSTVPEKEELAQG